MTVGTFRYRFTGEVVITVNPQLATDQQIEEIADQAVAEHADRLLDCDHLGIHGPETLSPGVTGEVVKIGTWDRA